MLSADNLRRADNQKVRDYQCAVNGGQTGRPRSLEQERLDAVITLDGNDLISGVLTRREFLELSWKVILDIYLNLTNTLD